MKNLITRLASIGAVFAMIICLQTVVFSQEKPLTIDQVSRAIATFRNDKKLLEKIISDVRSRGVDFLLTAENNTRLRKEGASDEIFHVIIMSTENKNCREQIERFNKIVQTDSKNAQAFFERGKSYKNCSFILSIFESNELDENQRKKYLDQAKNDFDKAIELEPNLASKIAPSYIFIGTQNRSILELTRAIELDPKLYDGYLARANLFKNNKDYDNHHRLQ